MSTSSQADDISRSPRPVIRFLSSPTLRVQQVSDDMLVSSSDEEEGEDDDLLPNTFLHPRVCRSIARSARYGRSASYPVAWRVHIGKVCSHILLSLMLIYSFVCIHAYGRYMNYAG